jgi:hypothetical protein
MEGSRQDGKPGPSTRSNDLHASAGGASRGGDGHVLDARPDARNAHRDLRLAGGWHGKRQLRLDS